MRQKEGLVLNAPVDVSSVFLETPRLFLRPWRQEDLADLYAYAQVDGVGQMAGWKPHESPEESQQILDSFIRHRRTLALEDKQTGHVIGSIGLEPRGSEFVSGKGYGREIGYILSRDYWGRGLMPEAVKAVMDYCFSTLNWDYLLCAHFSWNHQSRRVIEKCGFSYLGEGCYETQLDTIESSRMYIRFNPNRKR